MVTSCSPLRVYSVIKSYVKLKPISSLQGRSFSCYSSFKSEMTGGKDKLAAMERNKKQKSNMFVWRPVSTIAHSNEESLIRDVNLQQRDGDRNEELPCSASSTMSNSQQSVTGPGVVIEAAHSTITSSLDENVEAGALEVLSAGKHSVSIEVGASLIRFIRGKGGKTKEKIEEEMGVKIIFPASKDDELVVIEGPSVDCVTSASDKVQGILDEAIRSHNLDYSHFVSLPLAIHPELVDKLVKFQNSVMGNDEFLNENLENDSTEGSSDNEVKDQETNKRQDVAVGLKVGEGNNVRIDLTSIPLVSYKPKPSQQRASTSASSGIDKSIFIKPQTFHLTVLMLKLWNKERVNAASETLKNLSSKVLEAMDNRPVSIKLKGLECMRGSLAKARVLYATIEECDTEGRLVRACEVIRKEFAKAGLVLEKDAKEQLKLHATVMNARLRKGKGKMKTFDARGTVEQFGDEDWGEYLISEAHLSQRFAYDSNGYYHCCASIPFPETESKQAVVSD
ncbi:unnamed protein product [Linum tenue]|uniref:K Homology domain-containing protein n=1 Tax=Linum tenue TaxID=586396 RepID=A0AAV0KQJ4_9ROSI|nr:unnamed protein product [Linum tenue]